MPRDIKKDIHLLQMLSKMKGDQFSGVLDSLTDETIDNVCECVYNVIYNPSLKISSRKRANLKKFIKSKCSIHKLKTISDKKQPLFKRRQVMRQEGKGLPFLLASAIPFLINLFTKK